MNDVNVEINIPTHITSCAGGRHNMPPPPASWPLTFLPLKWSESRVTWANSVAILVFLGLFVLDLGQMYVRQTSDVHHHLMPPTLGAGHNKPLKYLKQLIVSYW